MDCEITLVMRAIVSRCESEEQVRAFLSGGFTVVQDRCRLYESLESKHPSISSHFSSSPVIRLTAPCYPSVLIGTKPQFVGKGEVADCTWIQLEPHGAMVDHITDFIVYQLTQRNQGPYGTSSHTEINPILLQDDANEALPVSCRQALGVIDTFVPYDPNVTLHGLVSAETLALAALRDIHS